MFMNGAANPKSSAFVATMLRPPEYATEYQADYLCRFHSVSIAAGAGEVNDYQYCKIVTDA